jgi:hypothetical protein
MSDRARMILGWCLCALLFMLFGILGLLKEIE